MDTRPGEKRLESRCFCLNPLPLALPYLLRLPPSMISNLLAMTKCPGSSNCEPRFSFAFESPGLVWRLWKFFCRGGDKGLPNLLVPNDNVEFLNVIVIIRIRDTTKIENPSSQPSNNYPHASKNEERSFLLIFILRKRPTGSQVFPSYGFSSIFSRFS